MKLNLPFIAFLLIILQATSQNNQDLKDYYSNTNLTKLTTFFINGNDLYFDAEEGTKAYIHKIDLTSTAADKDIEKVIEYNVGAFIRGINVKNDFLYLTYGNGVSQYNISSANLTDRTATLKEFDQRGTQGVIVRPRKLFISYSYADRGPIDGFYVLDDIHNNPIRKDLNPNAGQGLVAGALLKRMKTMYYVDNNFIKAGGKLYKVQLDNNQEPIYNTKELIVNLNDLPYAYGNRDFRVSQIFADQNEDFIYLLETIKGNVFKINLRDTSDAPKLILEFNKGINTSISYKDDKLFISDDNKIKTLEINNGALSTADFSTAKLLVYPNPSSDFIQFNGLKQPEEVIVYSQLGKIIKKETIVNNKLDIQNLKNGIYFLKIKEQTIKFIKQ